MGIIALAGSYGCEDLNTFIYEQRDSITNTSSFSIESDSGVIRCGGIAPLRKSLVEWL